MRSSSGRPRTEAAAALIGAAALLVGNGGEPAGADAVRVLDAVQARYEAVHDFSADFVQTATVASLARNEVSRGQVWVKRPGRMRWEYSEPEPRVIAIDGETLRIYSPEDRQVQIAALGTGVFSPTALDFLLGEGDLANAFRAERLPDDGDGSLRLKLLPRGDARFEQLELRVARDTHQLLGSVLVDVLGNRTELAFTGLVENGGVADERFSIDVPTGTEVIDLR